MSKVATYLQGHILGEVSTEPSLRAALSHDASVLEVTPELVVYPRVTNDLRKAARFAWQLAEKGHVLPLTVRGGGTDSTGAAIGKGALLMTKRHLGDILEYDQKQKLIRLQPGVSVDALRLALRLHGQALPALGSVPSGGTVGGAVAGNIQARVAEHGDMLRWTKQLEVVLASGDVLQTGRLAKRDVAKKKDEQSFEGEIYRQLDQLITDNKQLINEKLDPETYDGVGYSQLVHVKRRDGSMDLTPLFVGSQGTLGIISEMILGAEYIGTSERLAVLSFDSGEAARDAIDLIERVDPSYLEYFDGGLFATAKTVGKSYDWLPGNVQAVVAVGFTNMSDHASDKRLRKLEKAFAGKSGISIKLFTDRATEHYRMLRDVTHYYAQPGQADIVAPALFDHVFIPRQRLEEFMGAVQLLADKHHILLPAHGDILHSTYSVRPQLSFRKVTDKQKLFKLLDEYSNLVASHGGHLIGDGSEGRLKARFAHKQLDGDIQALFAQVKNIFDPYHILNPGVKESSSLKDLVSHLRSTYTSAEYSEYTASY